MPVRAGLVAAVQSDHQMMWPGDRSDQAADFGDGQRDRARVGGREMAGPDGRWRLAAGTVFEQGGGDDADRERGHDQHGVPGDRVIQADLRLIQAEVVLAELEALFDWPSEPGPCPPTDPRRRGSGGTPVRRCAGGGGSAGKAAATRCRLAPRRTSGCLSGLGPRACGTPGTRPPAGPLSRPDPTIKINNAARLAPQPIMTDQGELCPARNAGAYTTIDESANCARAMRTFPVRQAQTRSANACGAFSGL